MPFDYKVFYRDSPFDKLKPVSNKEYINKEDARKEAKTFEANYVGDKENLSVSIIPFNEYKVYKT
jgi:hypothetical protein